MKMLILSFLFSFPCCVGAQTSYRKKVERSKDEFKEIADYTLNKYSNNQFSKYIIITLDTVTDEKILRFCKEFDIKNIYIQDESLVRTNSKYQAFTVSFMKNYIPLLGKRREVFVDYKSAEYRTKYPYLESFKMIDENIYYIKY